MIQFQKHLKAGSYPDGIGIGTRYASAVLAAALVIGMAPVGCRAQCNSANAATAPVTVDNEAATIPNSRQLTNGNGTAINASVPNQISINAALSAQAEITGSTTGIVGNVYPVSTASGAVAFTLPDATAPGNAGGAIAVFLKTAGNTLTFDTTAGQTMGGTASGGVSTSTVNTLFYFVSDGSNWQYWQAPASGSGSGTVNTGTAGQVAYYASSTNAVSGQPNLTISGAAVTVGTSSTAGSVALANGSYTNKFSSAALTGNSTCTLPNANSNPVVPSTAGSNQFATGVGSGGVISYAQPSFSNISGTATTAQIPFAAPGPIGGTTPSTAVFTNIQDQGVTSGYALIGGGSGGNITGVQPNTNGNVMTVVSGAWASAPPSSGSVFGGNGADGAQSVTSTSSPAASKVLKYWTTYSVSGSGQDEYLSGSIVNCSSTFSNTATSGAGIDGNGQGYNANGSYVGGGPAGGQGSSGGVGGGGGGSVYANGGGNNAGTAHFLGGTGASASEIRPFAGSAGGGVEGSGAGANGGGAITVEAAGAVSMSPSSAVTSVDVRGAAGTAIGNFGMGGGGGGAFFCYSQTSITIGANATLTAAGGTGGAGSASGKGGSGGGGGVIYLMSPSNSVSGTLTVTGGAAGTDGYAAGNNGVAVQVTDTPTLPVISLDLDFRALRNVFKIAQYKQRSNHIKLSECEHDSFVAAFYAAPGHYWDLRTALKQDGVDPRSLCADRFFGPDHKGGNKYTFAHIEGLPSVVTAEPICIVDYQVGNIL